MQNPNVGYYLCLVLKEKLNTNPTKQIIKLTIRKYLENKYDIILPEKLKGNRYGTPAFYIYDGWCKYIDNSTFEEIKCYILSEIDLYKIQINNK